MRIGFEFGFLLGNEGAESSSCDGAPAFLLLLVPSVLLLLWDPVLPVSTGTGVSM